MKKLALRILAIALLAVPFLTSCKDDDKEKEEGENATVLENLKKGVMEGKLTEDYSLEASTSYKLTGSFTVTEGATLTIPAGTEIIADAGGTEVYIGILTGSKINIEGSSTSPVVMTSAEGNPGDWGGLTICGLAKTTAGADAVAEVGGFIYGGADDADNSGSIRYLVIKGTGASINSESQYNGVSFYAVGSGTTVENLAVINGSDDGVEFFGGSVSVTNLFLENNEDDAIDWTEGWNGTVTNAYVSHTIADFSTVVEADKDNNNPKIINLTAISTTGGTALQFKKESGSTITGLYLSGYEVDLDMKDEGSLSNVFIDGANPDATLLDIEGNATKYELNSGKDSEMVDISDWTWVSAGVSAELTGNVVGKVTLNADTKYKLTGSYIVQEGAELTIPAGTKITAAADGTSVYIAVLMGGKININGTADNPVVISSANAEPGDWGGLTICGKASTTAGVDAVAEVGGFVYGGNSADDNSGSITYLVIKGTGASINSESQYNGVSLYAVGSGTTLENIAVIDGADDGIEFFGGSAMVKNIYLENNEDDAVDWTEGWNGAVENTYISHTIEGFSTAFEGDKDNGNPTFTNVTAISNTGGTGLQFKKESGATITGLHIEGYDIELNMKDAGATTNVIVDGSAADVTDKDGEGKNFDFNSGADSDAIDISSWTWRTASL
ncbi:hypothetical protein [Saccharicrinis aurantiacus]|uniref:hypothetical protein n=1 Tax=Saccharicrinis aurantiacus TaxID=1849719 RepID=UPI00094F509C|nr:hypothetical protein [Saccharicrinis aurantiacus]